MIRQTYIHITCENEKKSRIFISQRQLNPKILSLMIMISFSIFGRLFQLPQQTLMLLLTIIGKGRILLAKYSNAVQLY